MAGPTVDSAMRDIAIGIDIGTTGVKAVAVTTSGEVVFESTRPHDLIAERSGFAEEDAEEWWESTKQILAEIASQVDCTRVVGLGFSGMVPALVLVAQNGAPVRNSIQQNDARAVQEIAEFKALLDEQRYFGETGNSVNQQVVFPKLRWMDRHEPDSLMQAAYLMGSYDYCAFRLTGVPAIERNWALESGMWLIEEERWHDELLQMIPLSPDLLPPVYATGEILGESSEAVARETGFPAGVPVIAGIADHVASALSTGVRSEGDLLLKLGGAGDVLYASDDLRLDPRMFIDYHPFPGKFLINGCMSAGGSIVKWITNLTQDTDFDRLTVEAETRNLGDGQIIVLPYFLGEKTPIFDTDARGVIFGLSLNHDRAALFRAVLEAVAFGFRHHVDVLEEMGCGVRNVYLSNGGARSPLWRQIVLDVIGSDGTYVPNHPGSCIGAAFAVLQNLVPSHESRALEAFLARGVAIRYSQEQHERYSHYYALYRDLYEQLKPLFPRLHSTTRDWARRDI